MRRGGDVRLRLQRPVLFLSARHSTTATSQHSVGLVLMALTIRAAIEEGAREFDMLLGRAVQDGSGPATRDRSPVHLFPPDLGGTMHRSAAPKHAAAVRALVHRLGLKGVQCTLHSRRPAGAGRQGQRSRRRSARTARAAESAPRAAGRVSAAGPRLSPRRRRLRGGGDAPTCRAC